MVGALDAVLDGQAQLLEKDHEMALFSSTLQTSFLCSRQPTCCTTQHSWCRCPSSFFAWDKVSYRLGKPCFSSNLRLTVLAAEADVEAS